MSWDITQSKANLCSLSSSRWSVRPVASWEGKTAPQCWGDWRWFGNTHLKYQNIFGPLFLSHQQCGWGAQQVHFRDLVGSNRTSTSKKQWILVEVLHNQKCISMVSHNQKIPYFGWRIFSFFFDKTSPEIAQNPPVLVLEGQTLAGFFGLLSVVQGTGAHRNQHGAWDAQPWDGDDQWVFGGYVTPGLINHCLSGWWFQPLWKILVRLDHHPNYWGK